MFPRVLSLVILLVPLCSSVFAQKRFTVVEDLREEWMTFKDGAYQPLDKMPFAGVRTIYFQLGPAARAGSFLRVTSEEPYFIFLNGKVLGMYAGRSEFRIDSLLSPGNRASWVAVHQRKINARDLATQIISRERMPSTHAADASAAKPYSHFRDFVVVAGMLILLLFVAARRLNPKLAADYFSVSGIFTSREVDDGHSSALLTSGSNIQFYVLCSLLTGFYLLIVLVHLPPGFALPVRFQASEFWMMCVQWLKLSAYIFLVLLARIFIIFLLTRLFDMRGIARFHFFNWIRLLLVVLSAAAVILFMYFIARGDRPEYYVIFLSVVIAVLIAWIVMAFFKMSGRTGHSMFHLFSYLCATEIIPLLITVKVLFQ